MNKEAQKNLDKKDEIILDFMNETLKIAETAEEYVLLSYANFIKHTGLEIESNELFARLQSLSNSGFFKSEVITTIKDGEKLVRFGYARNEG